MMIGTRGWYTSLSEVGGLAVYPFPVTAMAVKAFYDGSGDPRTKTDPYFVLSGYAASKSVFAEVEAKWRSVTEKYGASYLHMREAACLRGEFNRAKGWDGDKADRLVLEAASSLKEFGDSLWAVAYGVNLKEWGCERKRMGRGSSYQDVYEECARFCFGNIVNGLHEDPNNEVGKLEIYHANGDSMLFSRLVKLWKRRDIQKKHEWARRLLSVSSMNMRITPGLQMADLLAWATRRTLHQNDIGGLFPFLTGIGNRVFTNIRRE